MSILKTIWNILFGKSKKPKPPTPITMLTGGPTIAVINATTVLSDAQVKPVVDAMQIALNRDFAPIWGTPATLKQIVRGQNPPAGAWWMVLLDTSDVAGALGYHDLTSEDLPLGKIFVKTCMDNGDPWSTCFGHELYEALIDPYIDLAAQADDGRFFGYEVADAVEAYSYDVNGIAMTDFVTPAWFQSNVQGAKYDFMGKVSSPYELAPGGYISVFDPNNTGGWGIITADKEMKTLLGSRAAIGSRRDKRRTPKDLWVRSTAHS